MKRATTPTLAQAVRAAIEARLVDVHTSIPARVESYDAAKLKVSVKPLIKRGYPDEAGDRVVESLPVITDVPVAFLGTGAFRFTFPIAKGDTVMLMFSQASLDIWLAKGGEVDPVDDRHHSINDAIAIPVDLRPFTNAKPASTDALVVEASEIRLGSDDASDPVALKSDLDALKNAISNAAVSPNDGGASFKSSILAALAEWPVSASKVTAE